MRVRCIAELPTSQQAEKLGRYYKTRTQAFGIAVGQEYVVFALKVLGGQLWIDITDPHVESGYLFSAPFLLFELIDGRVPSIWEARVTDRAELKMAPKSFFAAFYYDRLFEGVEDNVADFRRVRQQLELEDRLSSSSSPSSRVRS